MDILLAAGLFGVEPKALDAAVILGVLQCIHYWRREGNLSAFPVQVRIAYLAMLCLGLTNALRLFHWIQLAGTTALLVFDYCPLARVLALAPWNRRVPLTWALIRRAIVLPPVPGCIKL